MYLVGVKVEGEHADVKNSSIEYALRVISRVSGYKLYSGTFSWVLKVADKMGDMDLVRQFYIEEPLYIFNENLIPSDVEGAKLYKKLGGSKDTIGYGFATHVFEEHNVGYDLIDTKIL